MNVLFIIPPYNTIDSYIPTEQGQKKPLLTIPYGVLSIVSYCNIDKQHYIQVFDCNKFIIEHLSEPNLESVLNNELCEIIKTFSPNVIGISALFNTTFSQLKIVKDIKRISNDSLIVVGGGLATNLYKELFVHYPEIDAVCYGEGEIPFKKLLENKTQTDLSTLSDSWITKKSLTENKIPSYDFVLDLDTIPTIDLSVIDYKKYNQRSYIKKNETDKIEISLHTSRGCPFKCVFCANSKLHGKQIRTMSLNKIKDTIIEYKNKYNITILMIEDDHFLHDKNKAIQVLKIIEELGLSVEFPNGLTVFKIDEDIVKALVGARVEIITLAIESGSEYVLKHIINKPLSKNTIQRVVGILKRYNIRIHAFVVIGLPEETDEHRKESLEFLSSLQLDWVYVFIATPIVGSRLYDICIERGYIQKTDFDKHVVTKGNIIANGVLPEYVESYASYMNAKLNLLENSNFKKGNTDLALQYINNVIKSYPNEAIANYVLYKFYNGVGDKERSDFHFQKYNENKHSYIFKHKGINVWGELIKEYFE